MKISYQKEFVQLYDIRIIYYHLSGVNYFIKKMEIGWRKELGICT